MLVRQTSTSTLSRRDETGVHRRGGLGIDAPHVDVAVGLGVRVHRGRGVRSRDQEPRRETCRVQREHKTNRRPRDAAPSHHDEGSPNTIGAPHRDTPSARRIHTEVCKRTGWAVARPALVTASHVQASPRMPAWWSGCERHSERGSHTKYSVVPCSCYLSFDRTIA